MGYEKDGDTLFPEFREWNSHRSQNRVTTSTANPQFRNGTSLKTPNPKKDGHPASEDLEEPKSRKVGHPPTPHENTEMAHKCSGLPIRPHVPTMACTSAAAVREWEFPIRNWLDNPINYR